MQVLFSLILGSSQIVSELRQTIGIAAAVALALLTAWASWQLTDLFVARRQRLDEE